MTRRVSIVDLGMGNLRSVVRAFERVGARAEVVKKVDEIERAEMLVVPGQGAFADGARALEGAVGAALKGAIDRGVPYVGLCLGMQLLFESSEEAHGARGLGVFAGEVLRIPSGLREDGERIKVPHMGWNRVDSTHACVPHGEHFYFVHSYHCVPKERTCVIATTHHGIELVAAVAQRNVFAFQFHPEKSQDAGETLLRKVMERAWS